MTRLLLIRWQRALPVLFVAFLLLGSSGCAMVTVKQVKSSDSLVNKRADVLNTGKLSPAALASARTILGVGEADGKIDEIRESLSQPAPMTVTAQ